MLSSIYGYFNGQIYNIYFDNGTEPITLFMVNFEEIAELLYQADSIPIKISDLHWVKNTASGDPYISQENKQNGYVSLEVMWGILGILNNIRTNQINESIYTAMANSMKEATQNKFNSDEDTYINTELQALIIEIQNQNLTIQQELVEIAANTAIIDQQKKDIAEQERELGIIEIAIDANHDKINTLNDVTLPASEEKISANKTIIENLDNEITENLRILGEQDQEIAANKASVLLLESEIDAQKSTISNNEAAINQIKTDTANLNIQANGVLADTEQQQNVIDGEHATIATEENTIQEQQQEIPTWLANTYQLNSICIGNTSDMNIMQHDDNFLLQRDYLCFTPFEAFTLSFDLLPLQSMDLFFEGYEPIPTELSNPQFAQPYDPLEKSYIIQYQNCTIKETEFKEKLAQAVLSTESKIQLSFFLKNNALDVQNIYYMFFPLFSSITLTSLETLELEWENQSISYARDANEIYTNIDNIATEMISSFSANQQEIKQYKIKCAKSFVAAQGLEDLFETPLTSWKNTLQFLDVSLDYLVYTESELCDFFGVLKTCTELLSLALSIKFLNNFTGTYNSQQYLTSALEQLTLLQNIDVKINRLYNSNAMAQEIFSAFTQSTNLTSFELSSDVAGTNISLAAIFGILTSKLITFKLDAPNISAVSTDYDILISRLRQCTSLESFSFTAPQGMIMQDRISTFTSLRICPLEFFCINDILVEYTSSVANTLANNFPIWTSLKSATLLFYRGTAEFTQGYLYSLIGASPVLENLTISGSYDDNSAPSLRTCMEGLGATGTIKTLRFDFICPHGELNLQWSMAANLSALTKIKEVHLLLDLSGVAVTASEFSSWQDGLSNGIKGLVKAEIIEIEFASPNQTTISTELLPAINSLSMREFTLNFTGISPALAAATLKGITVRNINTVNIGYDVTSSDDVTPYIKAFSDFANIQETLTEMIFPPEANTSNTESAFEYIDGNINDFGTITKLKMDFSHPLNDNCTLQELHRFLKKMPKLTEVSLNWTSDFTESDCENVCRSLSTGNIIVLYLILDKHEFTQASANGIALIINSNRYLERLSLAYGSSCTPMTDNWMNSFVGALSKEIAIEDLSLTAQGTIANALTDASMLPLYSFLNSRMEMINYENIVIQLPGSGASNAVRNEFNSLVAPSGSGYVFTV